MSDANQPLALAAALAAPNNSASAWNKASPTFNEPATPATAELLRWWFGATRASCARSISIRASARRSST